MTRPTMGCLLLRATLYGVVKSREVRLVQGIYSAWSHWMIVLLSTPAASL